MGHSVVLQETGRSTKTAIKLLKYQSHRWVICFDLKMVNFLLGQQRGYTKFSYTAFSVEQQRQDKSLVKGELACARES